MKKLKDSIRNNSSNINKNLNKEQSKLLDVIRGGTPESGGGWVNVSWKKSF